MATGVQMFSVLQTWALFVSQIVLQARDPRDDLPPTLDIPYH